MCSFTQSRCSMPSSSEPSYYHHRPAPLLSTPPRLTTRSFHWCLWGPAVCLVCFLCNWPSNPVTHPSVNSSPILSSQWLLPYLLLPSPLGRWIFMILYHSYFKSSPSYTSLAFTNVNLPPRATISTILFSVIYVEELGRWHISISSALQRPSGSRPV